MAPWSAAQALTRINLPALSKPHTGYGTNWAKMNNKKVFDVVRPGKSPASPTSRPVISSHKPQIPDDQFVPSTNARLAGDPSEKRPLMDSDKKRSLSPVSDDVSLAAEHTTPSEPDTEPVPSTLPAEQKAAFFDALSKKPEEPAEAPELLPVEFTKEEDLGLPPAGKPTPEQLAVGQVVETDEPSTVSAGDTHKPSVSSFMTQDDVLAQTDAPLLERAVVSHHKHHAKTKVWEWLLIFFLIMLLALVALNFLLDAEVLTTELAVPHTDLLKN
jgi:hypothetical protein